MAKKRYGVAVPVRKQGFDSAKDIIERHLKESSVYFSTNSRFDAKKLDQLEKILFYSQAEKVYYLADLVRYVTYGLKKGIPDDAEALSPEEYKGEGRKLWLLINNLHEVSAREIHDCYFKDVPVYDKISTDKRGTIFYFTIEDNE